MLRRISSTVAVAGVLALAGIALAACGGGDNGSATATVNTAATSRPPSTAAAAPTVAPTQAAATSAPTAAATTATTPAAGGGAGAITLTEKDFSISAGTATAQAGAVTFNVQNDGPSVHELVVIKTDLAPDQLPVNPDIYAVDEGAAGISVVGKVTDIAANASKSLTVDLTPGRYVLICNLPAHYQQGMHTGFSVQ
jgi:uncharacterized cupredoxin-like copper-binding protein